MMRGMGWKTIAAFALFAAARLVHDCSITPTAYERFDAQEYVLYGEVVGYVSLDPDQRWRPREFATCR
jgi:hypothetical protein